MLDGLSSRRNTLLMLGIIILLGIVAYSNTFNVPFTFDDEPVIVQNERIRDLSNIPSFFVEGERPWGSRPMMHATNAINYYLGGLNTTGYHVVNLAIHLLNGALLYFLIISTGRQLEYEEQGLHLAAAAASLIFVLHPLQTEGVTYIVSRSALFATCFFFSGMLVFNAAVKSDRRRVILAVCLFAVSVAGMASRENFATFPVMLVIYDYFFVSNFKPKLVLRNYRIHAAAFFGLLYMFYLVSTNTYAPSGVYLGEEGIPPAQYVMTQFNVHWTYLRMFLFPSGQTIDHDYRIAETLFELPTIASFVGYVALWAGCVIYAKKRPVIAFGVLWFLITLAPISFLVAFLDLRLEDVLLEHRVYLPNAGVIVAATAGFSLLVSKVAAKRASAIAVVGMLVLAVVLVPSTYARNGVWQSNESQWRDVIRKSPDKWRGYYNLAGQYREEGRLQEAIGLYETAIRLNPEFPNSYLNLGLSYKLLGLTDNALEQYRKAIELDPNHPEANNNIGNIYLARRLYGKAIEHYERAVQARPDYADAHYNMGISYYYLGDLANAVVHYRAAIDISPKDAEYHHNLGVAYMEQGQADLARGEFEAALRLDPGFQQARMLLNRILSPSDK